MINLVDVGQMKSMPVSRFRPEDFGYTGDVKRLPIDTAYREVGWYRRALDLRSNGVSSMPFDLRRGDEAIYNEDSDDIPEVLDIFGLLPQMVLDLDKYGAAYAIFETDMFGFKKAWRRLHPSSIRAEYHPVTGELSHFERMYGYGRKLDKARIELDELLWLWMPSDNSENRPGAGVGFTALLSATVLSNKSKFSGTFFENGAINPTIVKINGFSKLPKDEKDRVGGVLNRMMTGIKNAFRITPMDGDVDVFSLMSNLKDMAMDSLTVQEREEIATTLGVPHSVMFSNAANYATSLQDDIHFYDKTIAPFCRIVLAPQLNERLFKKAGYSVRFDKGRLEVFQKQESEKGYALATLFDRGLVSANEIRVQLGMDELDEDFFKQDEPAPIEIRGNGNHVSVSDDMTDRADREEDRASDAAKSIPDNGFSPVQDELEKWERYALKRLKEGSPDKMTLFESDVIDAGLKASVEVMLAGVEDVEEVRLIFADARAYYDD